MDKKIAPEIDERVKCVMNEGKSPGGFEWG